MRTMMVVGRENDRSRLRMRQILLLLDTVFAMVNNQNEAAVKVFLFHNYFSRNRLIANFETKHVNPRLHRG